MSELKQFLDEYCVGYPTVNGDFHLLNYGGHSCVGVITDILGVHHVEIRPLDNSWDIGGGAPGAAVYKIFNN